jgi:hypothetical protein
MLTLLQVVRKLDLVNNLKMMAALELPEDMDIQTARYHAEAFLIAYLRHTNALGILDMTSGRRLLVPSFSISENGFEEPSVTWHRINYLAATRANPLLTGIAETIKWLDEQPADQPLSLFSIPGESYDVIESPGDGSGTGSPSEGVTTPSDETGGSASGG